MRFFAIAAALFIFVASGTDKAAAACNAICQAKCQQDPGPYSGAACVQRWSSINEKYGSAAFQDDRFSAPAHPRNAGLFDVRPAMERYYQR